MSDQSTNTKVFWQLLVVSAASKLADLLMSAKTTLPWLLQSLGAPVWMSTLLVPIRESGSLLPQWLINQQTRQWTNRISLWRIGMVIQTLCVGGIALSATFLTQTAAGWSVLVLLGMMSLGRAICSLTMKDIKGGLIEKGRRGRLVGWASSISGGLSIVSALLLMLGERQVGQTSLIWLLVTSSLLFALSGLFSAGMRLCLNASEAQTTSLFSALNNNRDLKHLIISRALMLHSALVAPYFIVYSQSQNDQFDLPFFIIASAIASLISSWVWGALSDKSAKRTLQVAGSVAVLACIGFYISLDADTNWMGVALFFLLSVAHAGIRTGRKTYLLDIAEGQQRTQYTATANTCVGIILLLAGAIYSLIAHWAEEHTVLIMALFLVLGLLHSRMLRKEK